MKNILTLAILSLVAYFPTSAQEVRFVPDFEAHDAWEVHGGIETYTTLGKENVQLVDTTHVFFNFYVMKQDDSVMHITIQPGRYYSKSEEKKKTDEYHQLSLISSWLALQKVPLTYKLQWKPTEPHSSDLYAEYEPTNMSEVNSQIQEILPQVYSEEELSAMDVESYRMTVASYLLPLVSFYDGIIKDIFAPYGSVYQMDSTYQISEEKLSTHALNKMYADKKSVVSGEVNLSKKYGGMWWEEQLVFDQIEIIFNDQKAKYLSQKSSMTQEEFDQKMDDLSYWKNYTVKSSFAKMNEERLTPGDYFIQTVIYQQREDVDLHSVEKKYYFFK